MIRIRVGVRVSMVRVSSVWQLTGSSLLAGPKFRPDLKWCLLPCAFHPSCMINGFSFLCPRRQLHKKAYMYLFPCVKWHYYPAYWTICRLVNLPTTTNLKSHLERLFTRIFPSNILASWLICESTGLWVVKSMIDQSVCWLPVSSGMDRCRLVGESSEYPKCTLYCLLLHRWISVSFILPTIFRYTCWFTDTKLIHWRSASTTV